MRELIEDTFSKNKNDDAHEHVERFLDIIILFNIPGVSHDAVMLRVFLITLIGATKRWVDRLPPGTFDSWDLLKKAFIQSTVHHQELPNSLKKFVTLSKKETRHYTKPRNGIMTFCINAPLMTSMTIKRSIKGSSSEGIAAIMNKLENLGRDMKKLKENMHAIQVGCQTCKGAHLDKDFPLKEEVKSIEEAKYGEFG
uniref:Retrotransposon gag domain-containing protein n=1 Tax=Tanacetum cinerariifolium TaxID=118510 RepID=A0A699GSM9_TANCI|nr:hypothetical protein [Tanacetum cinerariifolium]